MTNQLTTPRRPRSEHGFAERFIEPLARMRSGVDHLIEDSPARLSAFPFTGAPAVEMAETDDCYNVAVEVPGIAVEDIDLQVDHDTLILKGEKKEERQEADRDYVISERSYGTFERRIALPADALTDDIKAEASDGILRVSIPRSADVDTRRRQIEIHTGKKDV